MRQEARIMNTQVTVAQVRGYHCSSFKSYKIFTSDRFIKLNHPSECKKAGYGIELETECYGMPANSSKSIYAELLQTIVFKALPDDLFRIENDASLGSGNCARNRVNAQSAECVSQIMTKAFIRNNYKNFKTMYEYFQAFQVDNVSSGNCGMHVNISNYCFGPKAKDQDQGARKLYYIINRHYELMCSMLCRGSNRNWCGRMRYEKEMVKTMDLNRMDGDHHNCCNWSHFPEGRVELRLVGAQKNFPAFRNTMETVFQLVEASKSLSWNDLDDVTKIFEGCNQYVYDRLTKARNENQIDQATLLQIAETVKPMELI